MLEFIAGVTLSIIIGRLIFRRPPSYFRLSSLIFIFTSIVHFSLVELTWVAYEILWPYSWWAYHIGNFIGCIIWITILILSLDGFSICYEYLEETRPDEYIIRLFIQRRESYYYNNRYRENGIPPRDIYILNFRHNINNCRICLDEFDDDDDRRESILHCGHRYHTDCLREWELSQFNRNYSRPYQCALCRKQYDWTQKYDYIHME